MYVFTDEEVLKTACPRMRKKAAHSHVFFSKNGGTKRQGFVAGYLPVDIRWRRTDKTKI